MHNRTDSGQIARACASCTLSLYYTMAGFLFMDCKVSGEELLTFSTPLDGHSYNFYRDTRLNPPILPQGLEHLSLFLPEIGQNSTPWINYEKC